MSLLFSHNFVEKLYNALQLIFVKTSFTKHFILSEMENQEKRFAFWKTANFADSYWMVFAERRRAEDSSPFQK